jgi:hypothetical protein
MVPDRQVRRQVVDRELAVTLQEGGDHALVLERRDRARGVHEHAARAHRGGARLEDRALERGQLGRGSGVLAPAHVGPGRERAEVRAGRVDEHPVVRARLLRLGRVAGADLDDRGAHPLGGAAQGVGAAGMALDGDDGAPIAHERRQVGRLAAGRRAQVEHALARLGRQRAAHRGRRARLRHEQALLPQRRREGVEGRVEQQALGQVGGA